MPEITELAWMPMKADSENSEAAAALKKLGPELLGRPGLKASYHGKPVEMPNSVEIVSVWESEDAYKAGHSAAVNSEAAKLMTSMMDLSNPEMKPYQNSIAFDKPFDAVASAPITTILAIFLPADVDVGAFNTAWSGVTAHLASAGADGFIASTHGWATEVIEHPKAGKSKVFVTASGWESADKEKAASGVIAEKFAELRKFSEHFDAHHTVFSKAG